TTKNQHNHRHQDLAALIGSIDKVGFKNVIALWQDPQTGKAEVVYGGGRIETGDKKGMERLPVVWMLDFDKAKAKFLRVADNRVPQLAPAYDDDILIDHLKDLKLDNFEYDFLKLEKYDKFLIDDQAADDPIFQSIAPGYEELVNGPPHDMNSENVQSQNQSEEVDLNRIYPTDNDFEVPLLLSTRQPTGLDTPINRWGTIARKTRIDGGLIHFYTDDYKFTGILNNPLAVLKTGCSSVVEPNFSTSDDMRKAIVLYYIYLKRYLARTWQEHGLNVWVDLAIAPRHRDLALIGVPRGYRCYATYTYTRDYDIEWLYQDYDQALKHSGLNESDILFWVYGGNDDVQKICRERGWLWSAAHQQAYHHNLR
ncbi:MAG: DUF4417 domain-containing protein, partial [Dehalococcoidales bacterium]|nr:DUF4417 domain-containing protein [Dehalococcoidales bacterium]